MNKFTMVREESPSVGSLLAVLCFGFSIKAATFDGCNFYDKETGNQFALGAVKAWADISQYSESDLPLLFGHLGVCVGAMKAMCDSVEVEK